MLDDDDPTDPEIAAHGPHDTPDIDVAKLPGFEVGFRRAWSLCTSWALEQLRQCLIAGGTPPASAAELERRFAEWLRVHGG